MRIRPLRDASGPDLRDLFAEEREHWKEQLLWDFADVSSGIEIGLERGTLTGRSFEDAGRTVAYCYYVAEPERAIVGSLFASASFRGQGIEERLLTEVLIEVQSSHHRAECQTLFSTAPEADCGFARGGFVSRRRAYMLRSLDEAPPPVPAPNGIRVEPLRREHLDMAAHLIYRSHQRTLDAALNLTYSSVAHCRTFVETLIIRSGCGRFLPEASFLVFGRNGPVAVLIATRLSPANGHVCQVSVDPDAQSRGIGTALMSASLQAMRVWGLRAASLSVTVDNRRAYLLYERLGFRSRKEFGAHAWVRSPDRIELPA